MPLIKIDYDESLLHQDQMQKLVRLLLEKSMHIYACGEDKASIFTSLYGQHHFSTASAEIEVRAKLSEYDRPEIE